jgi:hypothetical protein
MSIDTLTPPAAGPGDWDDFLESAAIVERYDRDEYDHQPRMPHRPARGATERAAIDEYLRSDR